MKFQFLNKIIRRVQTLRGLGEGFTEEGFRERERFRNDYEILANCILKGFDFDTIFDIGCANGFLLEKFIAVGKQVGGIELSPDVRTVLSKQLNPFVQIGDFSKAKGVWDLVTCIEVAEHIPKDRSEDLVKTACRLSRDTIIFSAAIPGQKGHGHINCRPKSDWVNMFQTRGWVECEQKTCLIQQIGAEIKETKWLVENVFVLRCR